MIELRRVYSSWVSEVGYDPETQTLHVVTRAGAQIAYGGVPQDVAAKVLSAPSIGAALHSEVRGRFSH